MMKKIKRSISSLTLRAFCRDTSNGGMRVRKEGWFFQKRQESALTQSDPSMDDGFNIAAFYVEGQLDFPNQVPENVLQLYRELYDMEQKVKALENEIAVYVMTFQNKSRPPTKKGVPLRRKPTNAPTQCCIPRLLGCPFRPGSLINEANQHKRPFQRPFSRPVPARMTNRRNPVSTAVQTTNWDNRGSRLSKVSWNSKVDVRYIGSDNNAERSQKVPLREDNLQKRTNEELKNVVHLKIKIPKNVLNLTNDDSGQVPRRLENEWNLFNSSMEKNRDGKNTATTNCTKSEALESVSNEQSHNGESQNCTETSCLNYQNQTESSEPLKSNLETSYISQIKRKPFADNESTAGNAIVGTSIVHKEGDQSTQTVGIPVKQPGKQVCESQGCSCKGSARNDKNLDKVRQSFEMTESELSILEKTVHSKAPMELKIRTEYGSVNVISHDPNCECKICETFGSHDEQHKHRGRSDEAAVISKKIIRVYYNGDYRNVITHTEECGCDICSNIEEHSYRLTSQRASILSTHHGDLVVKNRGVCGCKNCKTIEMDPHIVDVETMLSRTSSHVLDQCYYSDATIPSMQSFPREGITTTDDQAVSFSSPPSINSSDLSDNLDRPYPSALNVNSSDQYVNAHKRPGRNIAELHVTHDVEPVKETKNRHCSRCGNDGDFRVPRNARKKMLEFVKPSTAKSSPAGLNKQEGKCLHCVSCKSGNGNNKQDKNEPVKIKSRFSTRKNMAHLVPLELVPTIDDRGLNHPNNAEVSPNDQKADKKAATYNLDHVTLEDLIRDLIRGQPGIQKDKVYTVTLGEVANKAYTKIQIVDGPSKPDKVHENKIVQSKQLVSPKMPNGDASNSNVFFIKPLPSSTNESQQHSVLHNHGDTQSNNGNTNNRSFSSPACMQDVLKQQSSARQESLQQTRALLNTPEGIHEIRFSSSASDTRTGSDMPRKAFKLTISFGKKVASFFRQRGKRKTMSNHTAEHEVSQDNPKCLKMFTIYEEDSRKLGHVELLKIDVKPRYFTLEPNGRGEEANAIFQQSPILCLLEKNSSTQVEATLER